MISEIMVGAIDYKSTPVQLELTEAITKRLVFREGRNILTSYNSEIDYIARLIQEEDALFRYKIYLLYKLFNGRVHAKSMTGGILV